MRNIDDRFDKFVYPDPNSGCFLWAGSEGNKGYGQIRINGRCVRAHRFAYERTNGPIPPGLFVLHKCDTPSCGNPDHLFLGTNQDNIMDRVRKGRSHKGQFPYGVLRAHSIVERYSAQVWRGRKGTYLGTFDTIAEAERAVAQFRAGGQ